MSRNNSKNLNIFMEEYTMTFGEKLRKARKEKGLTQLQLGQLTNMGVTTIGNYETGKTYPQSRKIYDILAKALEVDVNYLKSENEEFILAAAEEYGYTGRMEAQKVINQVTALFAGGELADDEIDNVMLELQRVYWEIKEENKNKSKSKKKKKV